MSQCNLDHSIDDVLKKYQSQMEFLPAEMIELFNRFFAGSHSQETLNEVFHLLKKYDLSSDEEKQSRNVKLFLTLK